MRITSWTSKALAAIAAERGKTKSLKRLAAGALIGSSLALGAGTADATLVHAIQDASFDDRDLTVEGNAFGGGHYAYLSNLTNYPWVMHNLGSHPNSNGNTSAWLYNTAYGNAQDEVTPLSPQNALHMADRNVYQVLADSFESGRSYTLSAFVGNQTSQPDDVSGGFGLRLFDGTGGVFSNAAVLASANYSLGNGYVDDNMWHEITVSYTATPADQGKPIGIYLGPESWANNISVDNVTLTSIPEPGFMAMLGVGASSVVVWQLFRFRRLKDSET
jgi:hypothetical protein